MVAAKTAKKTGKENTAPARTARKGGADDRGSDADDVQDVEDASAIKSNGKGSGKAEGGLGAGGSSLQRKLDVATAERDRLRAQRDLYAKQFDELSNSRGSESDKLFSAWKEKSEVRANAQNEVIASLTAVNEKLQARIQALENAAKAEAASAGGVFGGGGESAAVPARADPKEVKALKERADKAERGLKKRNEEYEHLDKLYKAGVAESRKLLASRSGAGAGAGASAALAAGEPSESREDEARIDQASLRLYEDLADLSIANVRMKDGKYGKDKEYTFTCVQTVGKRSITFKLRAYIALDPTLVAAKAKNPYVDTIEFMPSPQSTADRDYLARLDIFQNTFVFPRVQLATMFESLRVNMGEANEAGEE